MVMRFGAAATTCLVGGGGGWVAAVGTAPMMPPSTPPTAPPATPPGTPPTTPAAPEVAGGSSSSLMVAISLGTDFGAISLPASNWRGITFTIFTGAGAAGGGGGGGGGGGATRKLVNVVLGSTLNQIIGMRTAKVRKRTCAMNATMTVQVVLVFPLSTNVCSNISFLSLMTAERHILCPLHRPGYSTSLPAWGGFARTLPAGMAKPPPPAPAASSVDLCNYARKARSGWQ